MYAIFARKTKKEKQELIKKNYALENQVKELQKTLKIEQEKGLLKGSLINNV